MAIRKRKDETAGADAKKLVWAFRKWLKTHDVTLEAARVESAQKKLLNKLFISLFESGGIGETDFVRIGAEEYYYDHSSAEKVSAEEWYKMWKSKEITKEQYFSAISVGKAAANKIIGEDQVIGITTISKSKDKDIRKRDASVAGTEAPVLHSGKAKETPIEAPKRKHKRKRVRIRA